MPARPSEGPVCLVCFYDRHGCVSGTIPGCCPRCAERINISKTRGDPECDDQSKLRSHYLALIRPEICPDSNSWHIEATIIVSLVSQEDGLPSRARTLQLGLPPNLPADLPNGWVEACDRRVLDIYSPDCPIKVTSDCLGDAILCRRYLRILCPQSVEPLSEDARNQDFYRLARFRLGYALVCRLVTLLADVLIQARTAHNRKADGHSYAHAIAVLYCSIESSRRALEEGRARTLMDQNEWFKKWLGRCSSTLLEDAIQLCAIRDKHPWFRGLDDGFLKCLKSNRDGFELQLQFEHDGPVGSQGLDSPSAASTRNSWTILAGSSASRSGSVAHGTVATTGSSGTNPDISASWVFPVVFDGSQLDSDVQHVGSRPDLNISLSSPVADDPGFGSAHQLEQWPQTRAFNTFIPMSTTQPSMARYEHGSSSELHPSGGYSPWNHVIQGGLTNSANNYFSETYTNVTTPPVPSMDQTSPPVMAWPSRPLNHRQRSQNPSATPRYGASAAPSQHQTHEHSTFQPEQGWADTEAFYSPVLQHDNPSPWLNPTTMATTADMTMTEDEEASNEANASMSLSNLRHGYRQASNQTSHRHHRSSRR